MKGQNLTNKNYYRLFSGYFFKPNYMKKIQLCIIIICSLLYNITFTHSQKISEIKAANIDWSTEIVNMILLTKTPSTVGKWQYEDGLLMEGILHVYKRTGDQRYLTFINNWAQLHIAPDGTIDQPLNSLDNMMSGFMILHLYKETGITRFKLAADNIRARFNTFPRTSDSCFWHATDLQNELWLDGLYMGMPFLATYGEYITDTKYAYNEVIRQFTRHINHLLDATTNLVVHAYDEDGSEPWALPPLHRSPYAWGRAIGWTVMGLSEVLDIIPASFPQRNVMLAQYVSLLKAITSFQDPTTGLWFQIIDHGADAANWRETSCSVMFVYALKRAIQRGFLDASYSSYVIKGYNGILTKISETGPGMVNLIDISEGTSVSADINYYYTRAKNINDYHGLGSFMIMNELVAYNNLPYRPDTTTAPVLPAPWQQADIGAVSPNGSASVSSNIFTVKGSGADIWGTADAFHFVYQPLSGDGNIVAHVLSFTNTNSWAKSGVMIRESLSPGSVFATSLVTPTYGTTPIYRVTTNASDIQGSVTGISLPYWVKIARAGNVINTYYSANGAVWNQTSSTTITMNAAVLIGLCVSSHNNGFLATSNFDNVSLTGSTVPPPPPGIISLNKTSSSSSVAGSLFSTFVNDGLANTRWGSLYSDPQWISIDLQTNYSIAKVVLKWETASAKNYAIQVSNDNLIWNSIKTVTGSAGGTETWNFTGVNGRYIRMYGTARNTIWGYSIWEFEVYGNSLKSSETTPSDSNNISIDVFPNPFTNNLNISIEKPNGFYSLKIIDINGKVLLSKQIYNWQQNLEIQTVDLQPGIYFLQLQNLSQNKIIKIIKQFSND